jgi:glc operon protein GlcG
MPLSLEEAQRLVTAAHDKARQDGLRVAVAVVDEGGTLLTLSRMDGAPPLASQIAESKAVGCALWHRDGASLRQVYEERPKFFEQVDRLVRVPMMPGLGSLLIRRAGGVLGAVGVSGGTPEQDKACAQAGLDALESAEGT